MHTKLTNTELQDIARRLRGKVIEVSHRGRSAHVGSALSCLDILTAAYFSAMRIDPSNPKDPNRDRFILSKGHAAVTQYVMLAERGFFDWRKLDDFNKAGSTIPEHPSPGCLPGIEVASGSLGHGLGQGLGMALAAKIKGESYRTYVCMSDGECNEGSVWEAAMVAPARGLDNLVAIVDFNRWQATGRSEEITSLAPIRDKFAAFGWSAHDIDGHDVGALAHILTNVPDGSGKPVAIIAHTIKGKGISFMEDDNNWHYIVPNEEHVENALKELGLL